MTTKEQELKALAQIRKIVDSLGEDSYIAVAFEGCFDIAQSNIENDWACSMKQRAESAEHKAEKLELDNRDLRLAITKAKENASKTTTAYEERIGTLEARLMDPDDLVDCRQLVDNAAYEAEREKNDAARLIVDFAEETAGADFQDAVIAHRNAMRRWDYLLKLRGRIERSMNAYH